MPFDPTSRGAFVDAMKKLFQDAKEQSFSTDQVAEGLAAVIEAFIKAGDLTGVTVSVRDLGGNTVIGNGTQTNTVHLK